MPVSVRLDESTQRRLERMARTTGRSKSDLIREAIVRLDEALDEEEGRRYMKGSVSTSGLRISAPVIVPLVQRNC